VIRSKVSLRRINERLQRKDALHDGRFQYDVTEVLFYTNVTLEQVFHPLLIMVDASAHETQQIIVPAADQMAFHQLFDVAQIGLEPDEILLAVIDQGDFREDGDTFGQFPEIDVGSIARDVSAGFETFHALKAGARRKPHRIRKVRVRHPPVLLQLDENINVDPIKLRKTAQMK
jgi:hypothetical protein